MIVYSAILLAALGGAASGQAPEGRDDTIYVLRGDVSVLDRFRKNVGSGWTGGTVLDDDPSDGTLTYWAYSERTAEESRAFLMPAAVAGIRISFERYDEAGKFPADRAKLDAVARECAAQPTSLFIMPTKTVKIQTDLLGDANQNSCLADALKRAGIRFTFDDNRRR